jgi:CDP-diacylglycerol pyrophosphatase
MKKALLALIIVFILVMITGCSQYVDPFVNAGNSAKKILYDDQCKAACERNNGWLPMGCTCPKPTPIDFMQSMGGVTDG